MRDTIQAHFAQLDKELDIRVQRDARWMDQKCTPDVVCFIADCIVYGLNPGDRPFVVRDVWECPYFVKNARAVFNKPLPTNPTAHAEYDKFIQQPLRLLAYAHILGMEKRGNHNTYTIAHPDILAYIAQRERNAFLFLASYIERVLAVSGLLPHFEAFKQACERGGATNVDYQALKERYTRYIIGNTAINGHVEVWRIFTKVLNVYAVEHGINGSERGRISKYACSFSDLMYNRVNWRDMNKGKQLTRQEAQAATHEAQQAAYNEYYVQKAMNLLRRIQRESEVHDQWAKGEATQVHHIFPKSQFPSIAHYIENLIKLTVTQHLAKAHPANCTQVMDRDYQLVCLLAKADTIEKSIRSVGERYYRKESFVHVVNTGLHTDMGLSLSFNEIKARMRMIYNA